MGSCGGWDRRVINGEVLIIGGPDALSLQDAVSSSRSGICFPLTQEQTDSEFAQPSG